MLLLLLSALALVLILLTVTMVLKRMLAPVQHVVQAARGIAEGDLDIHLDASSQDEIGSLSKAFQDMVESLKAIIGDINYLLNEMSAGNFRIHTREEAHYVLSLIHISMKLVKDGFVDLTKLISRTYPIADAGAAFQDMDQHSAEIVKAEFDFRRE